jgi:predicted Zn-dependent protease
VIATLVAEHPEAFRAQWFVGRLYFEQGRIEEAFTALDSATTLQPNAIEFPIERAEWLLRLGRSEEAEQIMRELPFRRHADREAHLVRALVAQDWTAAADSALATARQAFPANPRLAALEDSLTALRAGTLPGSTVVQPDTAR